MVDGEQRMRICSLLPTNCEALKDGTTRRTTVRM